MSRGLNKVFLIGYVGANPTVRYTSSVVPVVILNLYESEKYIDRKTGELTTFTNRHRLVFFKRKAELAAQYIKKGTFLHIEGKLRTRSWTDKDGLERYITEIMVQDFRAFRSLEKPELHDDKNLPDVPVPELTDVDHDSTEEGMV